MPIQYETNIDDMDPRLWPHVIDRLLSAGALDAWITPIIMKKGRPAFTLSVLCEADQADEVRSTIFEETTTIGIRVVVLDRYILERDEGLVDVDGETIAVKRAYDDGSLVNQSVEWSDVVAAAETLGLSAKQVLAAATTAAHAD